MSVFIYYIRLQRSATEEQTVTRNISLNEKHTPRMYWKNIGFHVKHDTVNINASTMIMVFFLSIKSMIQLILTIIVVKYQKLYTHMSYIFQLNESDKNKYNYNCKIKLLVIMLQTIIRLVQWCRGDDINLKKKNSQKSSEQKSKY